MPNRLADEHSPYLQQHAENPVDWYPWGEEAFAAAAKRDVPLFVSIGYATCHWCHVMEHQSFENEHIAALMNEAFVNIKVDREERPDIDNIYMTVCQLLTGHGGWPLNVVLTPDRKPIFAGTYIPPTSMHGRIGMTELIPRLENIWKTERNRMETSASEITELLRKEAAGDLRSDPPGLASLKEAASMLGREYDALHHGFGSAPKFPMPHYVTLLLRHWRMTGESQSLNMAQSTLEAMSMGGIYDQIGSGFHRYSTDREWLVPHFEKMLYDQALLLEAYTEAYQATGSEALRTVSRGIARYVERDLTSKSGGFFSAEDADSEGVEGKFYVWTVDELREILDEEDAKQAIEIFDVKPDGNYEDEATGRKTGANILHLSNLQDRQKDGFEQLCEALRAARSERIRPLLDDKILTDWNGLMIASLAKAGQALEEPAMVDQALAAARFVFKNLTNGGAGLLHRFRDGVAGIEGNLDDYAFLAHGCFELFQATQDAEWLGRSERLSDQMLQDFWDDANDGLFFVCAGADDLIVRKKESQDGAVPAGQSIALSVLARLARLTRRQDLETKARQLSASVAKSINRFPTAHTAMLGSIGHLDGGGDEVVIVGPSSESVTHEMLSLSRAGYHPYRLVVLVDTDIESNPLFEVAPHLREYGMISDKPTAYVCQGFVCNAPTNDVDELRRQTVSSTEH